jgi:hypothetical protein
MTPSTKFTIRRGGREERIRTPCAASPSALARIVYTRDEHRVSSLVHPRPPAISSVTSTPERRRHPRIPVAWPVRLWVDDEPLLGRAGDASRNGLWVTVPPTTALKLGKICWIDVMSDEVGSFTVAGEVRHVTGRRIGLETMRPVPVARLEKD